MERSSVEGPRLRKAGWTAAAAAAAAGTTAGTAPAEVTLEAGARAAAGSKADTAVTHAPWRLFSRSRLCSVNSTWSCSREGAAAAALCADGLSLRRFPLAAAAVASSCAAKANSAGVFSSSPASPVASVATLDLRVDSPSPCPSAAPAATSAAPAAAAPAPAATFATAAASSNAAAPAPAAPAVPSAAIFETTAPAAAAPATAAAVASCFAAASPSRSLFAAACAADARAPSAGCPFPGAAAASAAAPAAACPVAHAPLPARNSSSLFSSLLLHVSSWISAYQVTASAAAAADRRCPYGYGGAKKEDSSAEESLLQQLPEAAALSGIRMKSSIPSPEGGDTWSYPSEKQFYRVTRSKGHRVEPQDMHAVVAIHNAVNERAWKEVLRYERFHESACATPRLERFTGKPQEISTKAKLSHIVLGWDPPFDRHEWTVNRCGEQVKYLIDFYDGQAPPGNSSSVAIYIDARPDIWSRTGLVDRVKMFLIQKGLLSC